MIYGLTKGTDFEKLCDGAAKAEAAGVMTYYALARMAKEQGYPEEVSDTFIEMANQESVSCLKEFKITSALFKRV